MNCNIVKDLLPLYVDDCCSEESALAVKEHIESCPQCKTLYESMKASSQITPPVSAPVSLNRIRDWKASVLQSVLLFVSFAIITVGVALEAATPTGLVNGYWAGNVVVPATGFLLSLANWYFVKLYKSRKRFSTCSMLTTLGITVCGYIWLKLHYEAMLVLTVFDVYYWWHGIVLTAVFCVLSKVLSSQYAKMLGKE